MARPTGKFQNLILVFSFISLSLSSLLPPTLARSQPPPETQQKFVLGKPLYRVKGQQLPAPDQQGLEMANFLGQSKAAVKNGGRGGARDFLRVHNTVRLKFGIPPLVWDRNVTHYARRWANQRASDCNLQHSVSNPYGENIFWGAGSGWQSADVVAKWVAEEASYNATDNSCLPGSMCGHYTQVVWKSSQRLGCARVNCDSGDTFVTCNYDPPGNWEGVSPFA